MELQKRNCNTAACRQVAARRSWVMGAILVAALAVLVWRPALAQQSTANTHDAQHDFDFEFGAWKAHIRRLLKPLADSAAEPENWVELNGSSVVRKVWDGRANLGELDVAGPTLHIEGLSLRLYNPQTRQWSIRWANRNDGDLGTPMLGGFANGRGEFFNQEDYKGRAIFVRFVFSEITATTFMLEQAFSADGGKTWKANWIASFTRVQG